MLAGAAKVFSKRSSGRTYRSVRYFGRFRGKADIMQTHRARVSRAQRQFLHRLESGGRPQAKIITL
jgi:hypothetical protein